MATMWAWSPRVSGTKDELSTVQHRSLLREGECGKPAGSYGSMLESDMEVLREFMYYIPAA
jgi:hypothetical protein